MIESYLHQSLWGNDLRQGTHQEAQKSRTTTLPSYCDRSSDPDAAAGAPARNANCATSNAGIHARISPCFIE